MARIFFQPQQRNRTLFVVFPAPIIKGVKLYLRDTTIVTKVKACRQLNGIWNRHHAIFFGSLADTIGAFELVIS